MRDQVERHEYIDEAERWVSTSQTSTDNRTLHSHAEQLTGSDQACLK